VYLTKHGCRQSVLKKYSFFKTLELFLSAFIGCRLAGKEAYFAHTSE